MNPGTTMFIVVGIIGLLLYALKALGKGIEGFMSLDRYNAVNSLFVAPAPSASANAEAAAEALVNIRVAPAHPQPSYTVTNAAPITTAVPPIQSQPLTISDKQGAELQKVRTEPFANQTKPTEKPCPPMPDMSLYVRKDQIPCWGCYLK